MHLSEIVVYPVKSLGGIQLSEAKVIQSGLEYDRRWLLIDQENRFVSQRTMPVLTTLAVQIRDKAIYVHEKQNETNGIEIPWTLTSEQPVTVTVWDDQIQSYQYPNHINQWFSNYLNKPVRLVKMSAEKPRTKQLQVAPYNSTMSYADGYPFLVLSKASVEKISQEIGEQIDIRQFRANLIIDGCEAFAEDQLQEFSISDVHFQMVKPCKRCQVIGIHQDTGVSSKEPIRYLSKTRKQGNHIIFGMNAALIKEGTIHVGDIIRK